MGSAYSSASLQIKKARDPSAITFRSRVMPSLLFDEEERRGVFNVGMGPNYSIPFPVVRVSEKLR
jgi:hypothetical protein